MSDRRWCLPHPEICELDICSVPERICAGVTLTSTGRKPDMKSLLTFRISHHREAGKKSGVGLNKMISVRTSQDIGQVVDASLLSPIRLNDNQNA